MLEYQKVPALFWWLGQLLVRQRGTAAALLTTSTRGWFNRLEHQSPKVKMWVQQGVSELNRKQSFPGCTTIHFFRWGEIKEH